MKTPPRPQEITEETDAPESLATLWEAIPVDQIANVPPDRSIFVPPANAITSDGHVMLSVEQSDVGLD